MALLTSPVFAQGDQLGCGLSSQPGATLLLPYFEVDVAPEGRTTLFAVGNAAAEISLMRAVVWTNWGHPVMAFDVAIEPGAVRTFNVRDLLAGRLPETSPPAATDEQYISCSNPIRLPRVQPENLKRLLSGQPRDLDGLCYSEAVNDGQLLTGYITVDTVNNCSGSGGLTPQDVGYFGDCASGLAANDNVLWGDFFLIDAEGNYAQGERLVSVTADQTRIGNDVCIDPPCGIRNSISFWYAEGNRLPLPWSYQMRFLNGGGFDGGTELIVWTRGQVGPAPCGAQDPEGMPSLVVAPRSERGVPLQTQAIITTQLTQRVRLGGDDVPLAENFGNLTISSNEQIWVMPLMSAEQRFGVGHSATPVEDFCFQ